MHGDSKFCRKSTSDETCHSPQKDDTLYGTTPNFPSSFSTLHAGFKEIEKLNLLQNG